MVKYKIFFNIIPSWTIGVLKPAPTDLSPFHTIFNYLEGILNERNVTTLMADTMFYIVIFSKREAIILKIQ